MEHAEAAATVRAKWLAMGAVAVLLALVLRAAWVTEDAYITLRTVDNWVNGFGLRWNTDERVQGYTHPLWMFLLSVAYYFTRESYGTTVALGVLTTFAALLGLVRCAKSEGHALAALGLLMLSRGFVEFSTSGLENPLTHVLLAAFVYCYAVRETSLRAIALCAAALALNRTDSVLVTIPALVHASARSVSSRGPKATALDLALAAAPVFAWELFSLFYYGFLVPNTAFAKLNTGLPRGELVQQGAVYLLNTVAWDPPLLAVMGLGIAAGARGTRRAQALSAGAALYLLYVIAIGGDFMLGRFLILPLFLSVCVLGLAELPLEEPWFLAGIVLPFAMFFVHSAATERYPVGDFRRSGVADEHSFYRDGSALMMITRTTPLPTHVWVTEGRAARAGGDKFKVAENIGYMGYFAGPHVHLVDTLALTEPLLARLPARYDPSWRVGHYVRHLPEGYVETLKSGKCEMEDKSLCVYHAKLREIVAGELWSWSRLKTIVGVNLGAFDYLIDDERYRYPTLSHETLQNLSTAVLESALSDSPGTRTFSEDGIEISLGELSRARQVALSLDGNDLYEITFRSGTHELARVASESLEIGAMQTRRIVTPERARKHGFDHLLVRPLTGDGLYSVGYVRLVP